MNIMVNGDGYQTSAITVDQLINELGYNGNKVATAIDGDFLPIAARQATKLYDGAKIEIVTPHPGG